MIELNLNGQKVLAPENATILEVARENGIHIPTLCHDDQLEPFGACRLCLVEVAGLRHPVVPACTTPVWEGMVINTDTDRVVDLRRGVLELILSDHPQDCLTCEQTGSCALQDLAYRYGVRGRVYQGEQRPRGPREPNPFIEWDQSKCILCGKCVRTCSELQGAEALAFIGRGFETRIGTGYEGGLLESTCELCGRCVDACPTGAMTEKKRQGQGRTWELERLRTTCGYCGVGCQMFLEVKDNRIVGVVPDKESPVNHGALCVKGRFGYDYPMSPERIRQPYIRRDGRLEPADWEEALDLVASRLTEIKKAHGATSIATFASGRATNEDNYVFQKFVRAVLGSHNVDNCFRT